MKNRRFLGFVMVVLLLSCFAVSAFATEAQLNYVTDEAGLFTDEERQALEQRAEAISEKYQFGVYIVTLEDFKDYTNSSNIEKFAVRFYDQYTLGYGEDHAGTMLMLSMAERDYDLDYLEAAQNGEPVGQGMASSADEEKLPAAIALIPGAIAALLVGIFTSAPMHSAGVKRDADSYMVQGSLELHRRSDMFLHRSVSRRSRETQSSGNHSGGSHHYSSGSHSGRSGKF